MRGAVGSSYGPTGAWVMAALVAGLLGCDDGVAGSGDAGVHGAAPTDGRPPDARLDAAPPDARPPDMGSDRAPYAVRVITLRPEPVRLDLLWLLDDSSSMCGEQFVVPDAIPGFVDRLMQAAPDIDLAMTAILSDMDPERGIAGRFVIAPGLAIPTPGCIDPRNGLPYVPPTTDCEARVASGRLPALTTWGDVGPDGPGEGEVGADCADRACKLDWLRFTAHCLTTVGVRGSDYPAGMAALERATACDGPNASLLGHCCDAEADPGCARFFRPGAARAVVVISDRDDCSPAVAFPRDDPARCAWQAGDLIGVPGLVDTLRGLGSEPLGVFLWTAPPAVTPDGSSARWRPYDSTTDDPLCDPQRDPRADFAAWRERCCPAGQACIGPPRPTCSILAGDGAAATPRYRSLARAFGSDDPERPIAVCDPAAGEALAERIAAFAQPPRRLCLGPVEGPLRVTARCLDGPPGLPGAACDGPWAPHPGLALVVDDPTCNGASIELPRGTPPGAELRVEYLAPLPTEPGPDPAAACALPAACAAIDQDTGDGFALTRGWRCAAPGSGCAGGWCVGQPGQAPHCTIECRSPDDCAIGRCVPVHPEGCAADGGGCVCAE